LLRRFDADMTLILGGGVIVGRFVPG